MLPITHSDLVPSADAQVIGFAYDMLPADDAREAQAVATRIRDRTKASMIESGRDLIGVKERFAGTPGAFGAWLTAEFTWSERTAQNLMLVARRLGDHAEVVAVLPPITVYALVAPSTPEDIRQDVIRRVAEGERPVPLTIHETIAAAKQAKRQAQEEERKAAKRAKLPPEAQAEEAQRMEKSRKTRERREAKQRAERQAERQHIENAAEEVAGLIADRLGRDIVGVLASIEEHGVWDRVLVRLRSAGAERRASEIA